MHLETAIPRCVEQGVAPTDMRVEAGMPIQVGDRELIPLVGVSVYRHRRAFVGNGREGACARGVVRLRPVGVVERRAGRVRAIPIHDATAVVLTVLTIAGLVIPIALVLATRLTGRGRHVDAADWPRGRKEA